MTESSVCWLKSLTVLPMNLSDSLGRVYEGRATQTIREQFGALARKAFVQYINDRINVRLKAAGEDQWTQSQRRIFRVLTSLWKSR